MNRFLMCPPRSDEKFPGVFLPVVDRLQDVGGGLFAEPRQGRYLAGLARPLELRDRMHAERVP